MIRSQLVRARLSEQEVPSSILGDFNVSFDFPQTGVPVAFNILNTKHGQGTTDVK